MDHLAALLALRNHLLGTIVATTGNMVLAATVDGFTRVDGSFLADGFKVGMEVVPSGFGNNAPDIIRHVNDLKITVENPRPAEASAPNRLISVGIPLLRSWENKSVSKVDRAWMIDEDYVPGASNRVTVKQIEHNPIYVVRILGPANTGAGAVYTVAQAVLDRFPPRLDIAMPDGWPLRVSGMPAPYRSQLVPSILDAGSVEIAVTIPLLKRTINPI